MSTTILRAWIVSFVVVAAGVGAARADDLAKTDDATQTALSNIAALGPGVHSIKTSEKGKITSCIIVGHSRISTALGKAKGLEIARQRAEMDAKAQFVKWLKEKVSVRAGTDDETIVFLEGSEDNDKEALREYGKAVEKTTKKMDSIAEGVIRGCQLLHVETNGSDKMYTLVYGWDAKTAEATKKVKEINDSDTKVAKKQGSDRKSSTPVSETKQKDDKKIEDRKATSPDAKRFLP